MIRNSKAGDRWQVYRNIEPKHITIISDSLELSENLQIELCNEGYQVSVIHDGLRGLLAIQRIVPDLVIMSELSVGLTELEICSRLRLNRFKLPMILLVLGDNVKKRVAGLEAGANDCISLPYSKDELMARVHSYFTHRQADQSLAPTLHCGDLLLNRQTREVFRGNGNICPQEIRHVRLTAREFDLLEYMMDHYFQVLTRTQILEAVWGYDYMGSSNIIEVYIRYLRRKIGDPKGGALIQTVRGVGYILREND